MHRPLVIAFVLSALCHLLTVIVVEWRRPPPAPRRIVVGHLPRRVLQPARLQPTTAAIPSLSALTRQRAPVPASPEMGLDEVRVDIGTDALDSLLGDLGDPDPDPGRHTGVWRPPPYVDLPPVGDLAPSSAGLPVAGPRMLADLAARQTFALIDPDTGKLLKAWLFLVATGNCGGGGSNVKRLDDLLLGMKRGQASPRDLPIEYSVEQVSCGRGLRADELSRHRVILTDYVGVESTADLASHLASGGFAMTDSQQMEEMERLLRQEGKRNVERVELTSDHPLFHVFFDIDAATFEGMLGVPRPFLGLEIDGRLVAIGGLRYRIERTSGSTAGGAISGVALRPHLANMLYVNALAYGLVQPSALGGRYLQRASPQP